MAKTEDLKIRVILEAGEEASEAILNEFVIWLIANEAFQLSARLIMEWDGS